MGRLYDSELLKTTNIFRAGNRPYQIGDVTYMLYDNTVDGHVYCRCLCMVMFSEEDYRRDPDGKCYYLWSIKDPEVMVESFSLIEWMLMTVPFGPTR